MAFDRDGGSDLALGRKLVDACHIFQDSYSADPRSAQVDGIRAEVNAKVSVASDRADLAKKLAENTKHPLACYIHCKAYLADHPSEQVRREADRYLQIADDADWQEVESLISEYPDRYKEHVTRIEEYLKVAAFTRHRPEAPGRREVAIRNHDRASYEKFRSSALRGNDPVDLLTTKRLAEAYLADPWATDRPKHEAQRWLDWIHGWENGRDFTVTMSAARVGRGSQWNYTVYWPTIQGFVSIGGARYSSKPITIDLDHDTKLPRGRLGPFHARWGDHTATAGLYWKDASPDEFSLAIDPLDPFPMRHFNEMIELDNGKITLTMDCPEVVAPVPAHYPTVSR